MSAGGDRLGEPGGVVGLAVAHEREREPVGAVPDGDRGLQRLHPAGEAGSVAGEVGVALGEPATEFDDRLAQLGVALPADPLPAAGPAGRLVGRRDQP